MFPSWGDVLVHIEVVKVVVGLIDDPARFVNYVCEKFAEEAIQQIRQGNEFSDLHLLVDITKESRDKSIDPLCNKHLYYVSELPLKMKSKLYIFGERVKFPERALSSVAEGPITMEMCAVVIDKPQRPPIAILKAISGLKQSITDLHIRDADLSGWKGKEVIRLDPQAKSARFDQGLVCTSEVPTDFQAELGNQLSSCYQLEHLSMFKLPLAAEKMIDSLGANTNLRSLNMAECFLTEKQSRILCKQLQSLNQLQELYLGWNIIGNCGAELLAESIRSWGPDPVLESLHLQSCRIGNCNNLTTALESCRKLKSLRLSGDFIGKTAANNLARSIASWGMASALQEMYLNDCHIQPSSLVQVMGALVSCRKLAWLDFSGNPVASGLQSLDYYLVFPELRWFDVTNSSLRAEDFQNLARLVNNHGMPKLECLGLGYGKMKQTDVEDTSYTDLQTRFKHSFRDESDETLEALKIILNRVGAVRLSEGDFEIEKLESFWD